MGWGSSEGIIPPEAEMVGTKPSEMELGAGTAVAEEKREVLEESDEDVDPELLRRGELEG